MAKNRSKNSRGSNRPGEGLRYGGFGFKDGRNRQVEAYRVPVKRKIWKGVAVYLALNENQNYRKHNSSQGKVKTLFKNGCFG